MVRDDFYTYLAQTSATPLGIEVVRAKGLYLYDTTGRPILDLISGIGVSALGHGHPRILQAIHTQSSAHQHVMVYGECILSPQTALAKAIASTLPKPLSVVYFTNSGSEAVEGALKLVKRYTGRSQCVACQDAYHGSTHGALSLTGNERWRRAYRPLLPGIQHIPFGNEEALSCITRKTAAVFLEPVQGEAGVRRALPAYLRAVRARCTDTGTLLVLDEIQTGWGRTGTFWAFEQAKIVPDVVLTAKAMGGGLPLGAFISSPTIMACLSHDPVLGHISTFGGSPLACAVSLATLSVIKEEQLHIQALEKGVYLAKQLAHPAFVEVRQCGLMLALQLRTKQAAQRLLQAALYPCPPA